VTTETGTTIRVVSRPRQLGRMTRHYWRGKKMCVFKPTIWVGGVWHEPESNVLVHSSHGVYVEAELAKIMTEQILNG